MSTYVSVIRLPQHFSWPDMSCEADHLPVAARDTPTALGSCHQRIAKNVVKDDDRGKNEKICMKKGVGMVVDQKVVAYVLIALIMVIGLPIGARAWHRRRRLQLRRRGIKRHGH